MMYLESSILQNKYSEYTKKTPHEILSKLL